MNSTVSSGTGTELFSNVPSNKPGRNLIGYTYISPNGAKFTTVAANMCVCRDRRHDWEIEQRRTRRSELQLKEG